MSAADFQKPRHQEVNFPGGMRRNAFEDVAQVRKGFDVVLVADSMIE